MKQSHAYKVIFYIVNELKKLAPLLIHIKSNEKHDEIVAILNNVMARGCKYLNQKKDHRLTGSGGAEL